MHKHRCPNLSLMRFLASLLIVVVALPSTAEMPTKQKDPRHLDSGSLIPMKNYCDQPYVVITRDGNWLCVLTTGEGHEGSGGQHVAATISKDHGKTWSELIDIEPSSGPEASWVVPILTPSGRVYAIYTYNGDEVSSLPGNSRKIRADMLGWYCFKYSDDHGRTWSKRYRIPIRTTAADKANQWKGEVQIFWGIDKPKVSDMGVTVAYTKLGKYMLDNGEGWMMHSDNILTEHDPEKINWKLLPEGEHGVRLNRFGSIQEEFNHVVTGPDQMYMVYRTQTGYPCHVYSEDGGKTWTEPVHMTYSPDGRKIKNPRACPKLFKCENGKYLFWFHNHSRESFFYRNPAWLVGGVVRDGRMYWSEPEIVLYHNEVPADDHRFNGNPMSQRGMSYPDLIEQDGRYWITETKKTAARIHEIDPQLLEGMWAQLDEGKCEVAKKGMVLNLDADAVKAESVEMPRLPNLSNGGGFSIDLRLKFEENEKPSQVVLDSRDEQGRGLSVGVDKGGSLNVYFSDGKHSGRWASDPGLLKQGQAHHVTVIVDGGPNIITFVVDGKLCDGGEQRTRGWGRFDPKVGDINGSAKLRLSPSFYGEILGLRVYDRYLRTGEAVANYKAGLELLEMKHEVQETAELSKLWSGPPMPKAGDIPEPEGLMHSVIYRPVEKDDHKFIHGVAIIEHDGVMYANWASSALDENGENETLRGKRSTDNGKTWSALEVIAPGFDGPDCHSHGAYFVHQGEVWTFAARFDGAAKSKFPGLKAEAFVLNRMTDKWESRGIVMDNCWPYEEPVLMDNGNYITGGQDKQGLPVVAISQGGDLTKIWDSVLIPYEPELQPNFAETTVWAEGEHVIAVIRGGANVAWVSTSDNYGRTWTTARKSNLVMPRSKAYPGELSTGQRYLIHNVDNRDTLVVSVSKPGEATLSKAWRIRHGQSQPPYHKGSGKAQQWSYPYGYEHDGKLYIGYSIGKEEVGLSVVPIDSLRTD